MNFEKVCVLGLGYIGLPTAAVLAGQGVNVIGVDINRDIVNGLQNGKIHIYEEGLYELVTEAIRLGKLRVCTEPEPADAFIIAVPTPFYEDKRADMRAVTAATEAVVPHLRHGNLVVLESTSPPLTTRNLVVPILECSGLRAGEDFYVVYSPERVLPGRILKELGEKARVIGGLNKLSAVAGRDLYSLFAKGQIVLTDCTTAEMVKLMENTYRDINIAIANEFSRLADRFGVDIWEAISIANLHPRVKILTPGVGVGGHCIGVDPWFLVEAAPELTPLIYTARRVNDAQPHYIVALVRRALQDQLFGRRIAALGLSYKPDVDDLRESPAIEVVKKLVEAGAVVKAFEPYKVDAKIDGIQMVSKLETALADAEVVLLLVGHKQFLSLTPQQLILQTPARLIVTAANAWRGKEWTEAGFNMIHLGIGKGDKVFPAV